MKPFLTIAGKRIEPDKGLFTVAEIGLNHGGDVGRALEMVTAAARAGADAVKLQSLEASRLVAPSCSPPMHVRAASLVEFFAQFELDADAHRQVGRRAHELGLAFISTPFSEQAVEMLVDVGCDALKIASGDITHHRLIATAAQTRLPLVISTGMSSIEEIQSAVRCARDHACEQLALLHCVSAYPTPSDSANLRAVATLAREFGVVVGLSDHGTDPLAPGIAAALGAAIYERHFVADGADDAIDAAVSSTPQQLADAMTLAARVRELLGDGRKQCLEAERGNLTASRRGVYASRDLEAGSTLTDGDFVMLRPESDVPASRWRELIGRRLRANLSAGAAIPSAAIEPPIGE